MSGSALLGQILLWGGFLSGSLATVFRFKNESNEWATINWPWFIASVVVGAIGIAIYRRAKFAASGESDRVQSEFDCLQPALENLIKEVAQLKSDLAELAPSEIAKRIDERIADDLRTFAEARESIIPKRGLAEYANIMTQFAAGERAVNRAWSAGADGDGKSNLCDPNLIFHRHVVSPRNRNQKRRNRSPWSLS